MRQRGRPKQICEAEAIAVMTKIREDPHLVIKIASELNIHRNSIYRWQVIPLARVVELERILNVPRETLRPDFHLPVLDLRKAAVA